jgi:murein L,D-transpeptidase YafK
MLFFVPLLLVSLATQPGCGVNADGFGRVGTWVAGDPSQTSSPGPPPTLSDLDASILTWARDEELLIIVSRSCHRVDVYRWGHLVRRYPAVFGMHNDGAKLYEGDRRTPMGFYAIIDKRPHQRWARFLLNDYPNSSDAYRYAKAVESGTIPRSKGRTPGIGGAIGFHGSDKEELNRQEIDWTLGCISLTNQDVIDLDALVPVGTPVLIVE